MKRAFRFFLCLFCCFVAAKFFLMVIGLDRRDYLLGLTALLTANVYLFAFLEFRDRIFHASGTSAGPHLQDDPGDSPETAPPPPRES